MGYNYVTKQKQIPQAGIAEIKKKSRKQTHLQTTTPSYTITA